MLRANFETRQSIFTKNDFACACNFPHTPHLYCVPGNFFRYLERTFQCPILQAILVDLPMKPRRPPSRAAIPLILSRLRAISRLTSLASSRNNLRVFIDAEGSPAHAGLFISSRSAWSFARYFSAHHSCTACPPPHAHHRHCGFARNCFTRAFKGFFKSVLDFGGRKRMYAQDIALSG